LQLLLLFLVIVLFGLLQGAESVRGRWVDERADDDQVA
jgi:hypothetical protein